MLDNARAVADHVEKSGGRAIAVHCDVCDAASLKALKRASDAAFGQVSLLFANAGATPFEPPNKMPEHDLHWILHVHLIAVPRCIKPFLVDLLPPSQSQH